MAMGLAQPSASRRFSTGCLPALDGPGGNVTALPVGRFRAALEYQEMGPLIKSLIELELQKERTWYMARIHSHSYGTTDQ